MKFNTPAKCGQLEIIIYFSEHNFRKNTVDHKNTVGHITQKYSTISEKTKQTLPLVEFNGGHLLEMSERGDRAPMDEEHPTLGSALGFQKV